MNCSITLELIVSSARLATTACHFERAQIPVGRAAGHLPGVP